MAHSRIAPSRELILIEIERRCAHPSCGARVRVGLTKQEARAYHGFRCERCEEWTEDILAERDVPDWWGELTLVNSSDVHLAVQVTNNERNFVRNEVTDARKDDSL